MATVAMPRRRQVRITLRAISPRLATRTLSNGLFSDMAGGVYQDPAAILPRRKSPSAFSSVALFRPWSTMGSLIQDRNASPAGRRARSRRGPPRPSGLRPERTLPRPSGAPSGRPGGRRFRRVSRASDAPRAGAAAGERARTARIIAPPMTTMASGFCVCEPMPFESAAGKRPERRDERRHEHRAEPLLGRLARGVLDASCPSTRAGAGSRSRPGSRPGWRCRRSR